jgi:hypothetical protein
LHQWEHALGGNLSITSDKSFPALEVGCNRGEPFGEQLAISAGLAKRLVHDRTSRPAGRCLDMLLDLL